jgi:hypothetical protein
MITYNAITMDDYQTYLKLDKRHLLRCYRANDFEKNEFPKSVIVVGEVVRHNRKKKIAELKDEDDRQTISAVGGIAGYYTSASATCVWETICMSHC